MKFTKSIISIALISALAACGGSSSSKPPIVEPEPAPEPVKTVIQGRAIKGTIANAVVTVYKYVDGQAVKFTSDELETIEIMTELDGSYAISILDYIGPVKIELSVDENTTMMCDAPAGCGEVTYGEPIALATVDPTLVLSAISTVGSDNGEAPSLMLDHHTIVNLNGAALANINVSALTHLAAALIEADESGVSAESIQTQSSLIANAFNIMGSLTQLEPTAIEDAGRVAGEDNANELRYGLINAGIMAALFSGEQNANGILSSKLAEVVEDLIAHDGALLVNQDEADEGFELSLVEVLDGAGEAAAAVAEAIAADSELASQDNSEILGELEQQETNLENQSEYEEANEGEDGRSELEVEVPTEGGAIAKAKAMVDDVRLFSHLFEVGTDSNTGLANEGDKYITLINSAGAMIEAEAASFLLLADVTDALSEISMMFEAGTIAEGTFPIDSFLSIEGAVGSITLDTETDDGGMLFTISANSASEKVALNAAVVFAEDGLSINLNLDGSIESAGAMLSLTEGSFAKVNLDSAISRATLEDDSFDGEVTSGELSLEVVLEQKATDSVTNPVAFTGVLKTKLMPVTVNTLYEITDFTTKDGTYIRDEDGNIIMQFNRYGKSTDTKILPEMLTLSGGFSSLSGDLIKATLTVNIQDLENYEAPEFKNIGAPIKDALTVVISEDKNTVNISTADIITNGFTQTYTFTPGDTADEWSSTNRIVHNENSPGNDSLHWDADLTKSLSLSNGMTSYTYTTVTSAFGAYIETVVPTDEDNDGNIDLYTYSFWSGIDINDNGELVDYYGQINPLDSTNAFIQTYEDLDELLEDRRIHSNTVDDAAKAYAWEVEHWAREYEFELTSGTKASIFLHDNEEEVAEIFNGTSTSVNAYITSDAPLEDALSIEVSADSNTITTTFGNMVSTTTYAGTSAANFTYSAQTIYNGDYIWTDTRVVSTSETNFTSDEVLVSRNRMNNEGWTYYERMVITPIDEDQNGQEDTFIVRRMGSDHINDNGDLVDEEGTVLTFENNGWEAGRFTSYDDIEWSELPFKYMLPLNPFTTENALMAFTANVNNRMDNLFYSYADEVGDLESEISSDDLSTLTADSTSMFDAYVTHPDSTKSLENEDVFLDASAALSLEAILGDYQVKLMLSGNRTALNDGEFDLEMSYKLPDDENMRKFIARMKTDEAGSFSVHNSEGVLLIINDSDDSTTDVIGSIVVGSSATKVADIEDRDGVIWIVYSDETTETL
ncbi:MAG: hypothetical protein HRT54_02665 [Colwellia sp.]|nr:hypothetical protein [Colwellia sp.]